MRTITEPARQLPIVAEMDVVVAGGGVAGVAAAVAAARGGADTLLLERNGFYGGVATAGLMASMGNRFFDKAGRLIVRGVVLEMIERMAEKGGIGPAWRNPEVPKIPFDPEVFKLVLIEMVEEAGVKALLHTLLADVVTEARNLRGVIIENKAGRQAVLSRVVVDATGDADVAARAGAPFKYTPPGSNSMEFRMGNVDMQRLYEYLKQHPETHPSDMDAPRSFEEFERNWLERGFFYYPHGGGMKPGSPMAVLVDKAIEKGDYARERGICVRLDAFGMDGLRWNKTIVINSNFTQIDDLDVWQESRAEMETRKACFLTASFLRKYVPGFEDAFIIATAPDLGVRVTRWIEGEHTVTAEDLNRETRFDDVVGTLAAREGQGWTEIPYRCLLPKSIEGLLIASGKSASTAPRGMLRGMTSCILLGQAAGAAASLAAETGVAPRELEVRKLQRRLLDQGVYLGDEARLRQLGLT